MTEPTTPEPVPEPEAASPYKNLWVPLVVVPALIVVVIVLVFTFFGGIAGSERQPSDNLQRMLTGGVNERQQAAFGLVRQAAENWSDVAEGRELTWPMDATFLGDLQSAWNVIGADDMRSRYIVASLQRQLGDEAGADHLIDLVDELQSIPDEEYAELAPYTVVAVGAMGPSLTGGRLERASRAVAGYAQHADPVLRQAAAAALQNLDTEQSRQVLRGLLGDGSLALRGQAAISLSHLGDPAGADVLWELVAEDSYAAERLADERRWRNGENVRHVRISAVEALGRLARPADGLRLAALAETDSDPEVRSVAMRQIAASNRGDGSGE